MKNIIWILSLSFAALVISACPAGGDYTSNEGNENTNAAPEPDKELAAVLVETEKRAYEAWKSKDGKYFSEILTEGFVGVGPTGRNQKTGVEKAISENPCEVKSVSTSEEHALELGEGVALLTLKVADEVVCDGKTRPSPHWAATIYVKDGDTWRAAYHQTVSAPDAKGDEMPAPDGAKDAAADDPDKELTATLSAITKEGWEAWKQKDTKWFEENWGAEYLAITGSAGRGERAARIKNVADHKCEVKSVGHRNPRTTKLSDNVALFTYEAMLDGECDGTALPKSMWAGTIWIKDGDKWKSTFYMGTPGA